MKPLKFLRVTFFILSVSLLGCKKLLKEEVYSELAAENFLTTRGGLEKLLFSSYALTADMDAFHEYSRDAVQEMTTDILWQQRGGEATNAIQLYQFTWDAGLSVNYLVNQFDTPYKGIRDANTVLENANNGALNDADKKLFAAEAHFLRAVNYYALWDFFGGIPLRTSSADALQMPRADEATILKFIEDELLASIPDLPASGSELSYGRAHKGAAMGFLCRLYLNTKQWQKCADMAKMVMDLNYFSLFPTYAKLMAVENKKNKEMIWVRPGNAQSVNTGNNFIAASTPAAFKSDPKSGIVWQANWANFASDYLMYDAFYNTFEPNDKRTQVILTSFVNTSNVTVPLLGKNSSMVWKYVPDPNANGQEHGNDVSVMRYADILLSRAEALNEISGPTSEAISLINMVRTRAGIPDLLVTNFPTKESLRSAILLERGHEFFYEELRRRDLIRHGKFIEFARNRGVTNAQDFRQLFPIPISAINSNPLLKQNPGY